MQTDLVQLAAYVAALMALAILLSIYMARVFSGEAQFLAPVEQALLGIAGDRAAQRWGEYALSLVLFNVVGFLLLLAIMMFQNHLPLNPRGFDGLSWHLAFNTAVSFVTNTNWQSYGGETTMSHFSQMAGLTTQNFLSAATGMAVAAAAARGFAGRQVKVVGNFWTDVTRATLYVLLPGAIILAILFIALGVPQTLSGSVEASTLEGAKQTISLGPVASQLAIKQFGTNGGGFFNANSAHPFENPNAVANFLQVLAILAIPAAFPLAYGRMIGDRRQGRALFLVMAVLIMIAFAALYGAERAGNPLHTGLIDPVAGNMEGKETRFGLLQSVLFAVVTTAVSCGAVNTMHDSLTPLGGLVTMLNIQLGEIIYGGVGVGLTGMLLFVILTVFLAGLMVGRTPEYLGKKIEAKEVKLAAVTLLVMPLGVLALSAIAIASGAAQSSVQDAGPHGLSELIYAYSSATGNNGSAFAGFSANTAFHNVMLGLAMLLGRFGYILPILAIAGSLAAKTPAAATAGTFPTHGPIFVTLLIMTILIVGALTFLPVLALGPIAEHMSSIVGTSF